MENSELSFTSIFGRQKKGLVFISFLMIFLSYSGAVFENAIIPFIQVKLQNGNAIPHALLSVYAYFFLRWVQFLYQSDLKPTWDYFNYDAQRILGKYWRAQLKRQYQDTDECMNEESANFGGFLHPKFHVYFVFDEDGEELWVTSGTNSQGKDSVRFYRLPWRLYLPTVAYSVLKNVFMRPMFFEDFAPGILGVVAIIVWFS